MNRNVVPAIAFGLIVTGFLLVALSLLMGGVPRGSTISGGGVVVVGPLIFAFGKGVPLELILILAALSIFLLIPYLIFIVQLLRFKRKRSEV